MTETRLTYYDREGKRHALRVSKLSHRFNDDVLDGTAMASAPGEPLRLNVTFHVGRDVQTIVTDDRDRNPL